MATPLIVRLVLRSMWYASLVYTKAFVLPKNLGALVVDRRSCIYSSNSMQDSRNNRSLSGNAA